jgi:cytochrome c oxidase subunit 3
MAAVPHKGGEWPEHVFTQYEDIEQQNETYIVGMWVFLVTEVMFFGAMFLIYALYRWNYQADWYVAHHELSPLWGGINTTMLLLSSFTMVLAVHFAQLRNKKMVIANLMATNALATAFLLVKFLIEWPEKFKHSLIPGYNFNPHDLEGTSKRAWEIFFSLYFAMTGLHALHIIIGILIIGYLAWMWFRDKKMVTEDYIPTELVGLYWHFVDLVWIFLFPLFYLLPK